MDDPDPVNVSAAKSLKSYHTKLRAIQNLTREILAALDVSDFDLSLTLVDGRAMRALNRQHRNKDRSTDVLAFPQQEWSKPLPVHLGSGAKRPRRVSKAQPAPHLGDIVISLPTTRRNAKDIGHGFDREFGFLLVHGALHLCGYDHIRKSDELIMRAAQRKLMDRLQPAGRKPLWQDCVSYRGAR